MGQMVMKMMELVYEGPSKMPRNGKLSFFLKLADSMWRPRNEMIDKLRGSISESCPD